MSVAMTIQRVADSHEDGYYSKTMMCDFMPCPIDVPSLLRASRGCRACIEGVTKSIDRPSIGLRLS